MKNYFTVISVLIISLLLYSCGKKTDKDRAIELVEARYENTGQKFDFGHTSLDSLYNISPKAYNDSLKKGNDLDATLARLEGEIEHLSQAESDSVGLISARLTKERYRLLELAKTKPVFIGWKLVGVEAGGMQAQQFKFDKSISRIVD